MAGLTDDQLAAEYEKGRMPICAPPAWVNLKLNQINTENKEENIQNLMEHVKRMGLLEEEALSYLLNTSQNVMKEEKNCVELKGDWVVIGDLHGQLYDLFTIFEKYGLPPKRKYLFVGDYVDRGGFGCEIVLLLSLLKLSYPSHLVLLRGNHECEKLSKHFNFQLEATNKYNNKCFSLFAEWFKCLPLGSSLKTEKGEIFFVHGGPPSTVHDTEELQKVDRFIEPPMEGVVSDCLWSDPLGDDTAEGLDDETMVEWFSVEFEPNPDRGCGMVFGYQGLVNFLEKNNYLFCVRGHEVKQKGWEEHRFCKGIIDQPLPLLITVFSAPNYCDFYGNSGAVMLVWGKKEDEEGERLEITAGEERGEEEGGEVEGLYKIETFESVSHPFVLPKSKNGIAHTLPLIYTHLTTLVKWITSPDEEDKEEKPEEKEESEEEKKMKKRRIMREKILTYARMQTMLEILRDSKEDLAVIRKHNEGVLPRGLISARGARDIIKTKAEKFREAQRRDKKNEALPGARLGQESVVLQNFTRMRRKSILERESLEREREEKGKEAEKEDLGEMMYDEVVARKGELSYPLERHLHKTEFEKKFGMTFADFGKLPAWKQKQLRQKHKLF